MALRPTAAAATALAVLVTALACGDDGDGGTQPPPPTPTTGTVSGSVQDDGGQPVGGAGLTLRQGATTVRSLTTPASGAFEFADVEAGAYELSVTPPQGFELGQGQANPVAVTVVASQTTTVSVRLAEEDQPALGGVEGTVDLQGRGVQGVAVALEGPSGPAGQTNTDQDGDYNFEDLDPGEYTVTITPPNAFALPAGETGSRTVTVAAGPNADADFELELAEAPAVIQVQLTSAPNRFVGPSGTSTETIARGTIIRWVNADATFHTVTPEGHDAWNRAETQGAGLVLEVLFINPGSFPYFCEPHRGAGMTGTIVVN